LALGAQIHELENLSCELAGLTEAVEQSQRRLSTHVR
jgi:hypothetical protein